MSNDNTIESRLSMPETGRLFFHLRERKEELTREPKSYTDLAKECSEYLGRPVAFSTVSTICRELGIQSRKAAAQNAKLQGDDQRIERLEAAVRKLAFVLDAVLMRGTWSKDEMDEFHNHKVALHEIVNPQKP